VSTPEDRAAYIAGMRKLLGILEANPHLPLPYSGSRFPLSLDVPYGQDRAVLAAWEEALPVPLAAHIREPGSDADNDAGSRYDLDGDLLGLRIRIRAHVDRVAERRVLGTRTVEDVEWVRLPAEDPAGSAGEDEEPQS
jgi:hypothetical protein